MLKHQPKAEKMTPHLYQCVKMWCHYLPRRIVILLLCVVGLAASVSATTSERHQGLYCDSAAKKASQQTGAPLGVLLALTRTETGKTTNGIFGPWPWTVNVNGKGYWFESGPKARAFAFGQYKAGKRSFDIGCFQINYRWHGAEFSSLEEMFEPEANALYAAKFLMKLYREKGDWKKAVGAYHSRTPEFARRYLASFEHNQKRLDNEHVSEVTTSKQNPVPVHTNSFPLLKRQPSVASQFGSLVPLLISETQTKNTFEARGRLFHE